MSHKSNPPRQERDSNSPVCRHQEPSVGTEPNSFLDPTVNVQDRSGLQAAGAYSRAANRAGRQPLK